MILWRKNGFLAREHKSYKLGMEKVILLVLIKSFREA